MMTDDERRKMIAKKKGGAEFWKQKAEIAYRQADQYKTDYLEACQLVARMHQAATGTIGGPIRGAVEDIDDLRARAELADAEITRLREACQLLLDHVDYTVGNCGLTEMVGGVLPRKIIQIARAALEGTK